MSGFVFSWHIQWLDARNIWGVILNLFTTEGNIGQRILSECLEPSFVTPEFPRFRTLSWLTPSVLGNQTSLFTRNPSVGRVG